MIKELVDFNSREDFDRFMSNVENTYFESVVPVSKSPYSHLPHAPIYPPRPFPHLQDKHRSPSGSPARELSPDSQSSKNFDRYVD